MAGRGPAPKDPAKRAGKSKDQNQTSLIRKVRAPQPELPDGIDWHPQTIAWWRMWGEAPQSAEFMATDWDFLADTAIMHTALWSRGQWTLAAEIRLRVAKLGATPEDRQRLRMHFADEESERDAPPAGSLQGDSRWGNLRALPGV